jgi:hypothetical protein
LSTLDIHCRNPKRILEGGGIVHIQRHDRIDAGGFEQLRNIPQRQRFSRSRALVLPPIAQIGRDQDHACRA